MRVKGKKTIAILLSLFMVLGMVGSALLALGGY